jgi:hypothetical protein
MVNGKKLILIGFNVPQNAREWLESMRQGLCKKGIHAWMSHTDSFEICTPKVNLRVIINDPSRIRPSYMVGADVIFDDSWLSGFARHMGLVSPNVIYTKSVEFIYRYIENCNRVLVDLDRRAPMTTHPGYISATLCPLKSQRPEIRKVHFSGPVTCVIWDDGTKTLVRCKEGEQLDPEKGLAMAIAKKTLGTNKTGSNYYDIFKLWLPKHSAADHANGDGEFVEIVDIVFPEDESDEGRNDPVGECGEPGVDGLVFTEGKVRVAMTCSKACGCHACPFDSGFAHDPDDCSRRECITCRDRAVENVEDTAERKKH